MKEWFKQATSCLNWFPGTGKVLTKDWGFVKTIIFLYFLQLSTQRSKSWYFQPRILYIEIFLFWLECMAKSIMTDAVITLAGSHFLWILCQPGVKGFRRCRLFEPRHSDLQQDRMTIWPRSPQIYYFDPGRKSFWFICSIFSLYTMTRSTRIWTLDPWIPNLSLISFFEDFESFSGRIFILSFISTQNIFFSQTKIWVFDIGIFENDHFLS